MTGPGAVRREVEHDGPPPELDQGSAVGGPAHHLLDAGRRQGTPPEYPPLEPTQQILGGQDQLLVEGDAGRKPRRQMPAGEDALSFLDSGLSNLPAVVEGADPGRSPTRFPAVARGRYADISPQRRRKLRRSCGPSLVSTDSG